MVIVDFEVLRILTNRRIGVLRYIREHPGKTVAELAREIGAKYGTMRNDIGALEKVNLVTRNGYLYSVMYDTIRAIFDMEN